MLTNYQNPLNGFNINYTNTVLYNSITYTIQYTYGINFSITSNIIITPIVYNINIITNEIYHSTENNTSNEFVALKRINNEIKNYRYDFVLNKFVYYYYDDYDTLLNLIKNYKLTPLTTYITTVTNTLN
jgi:hypothetical protein